MERRIWCLVSCAWVLACEASRPEPTARETVVPSTAQPSHPRARGFPGVLLVEGALELRSEVSGQVEALLVELGVAVTKGDPLLRLATPELDAELHVAEAAFQASRARTRSRWVRAGDAGKRLARRRSYPEGFSTEATATVEAEVLTLRAEAVAARSSTRSERARLDRLRALSQRKIIRAPFDGVVGLRWKEMHARVEQGDRLLRFLPLSPPIVRFAVPPAELPRLMPKGTLEVDVEGARRTGAIVRWSTSVDLPSGLIFVEGRLDCDDGCAELLDGMSARVILAATKGRE